MLDGLRFAIPLAGDTNPIEFHYCRLRLKEAGAQVTVVGLDRLDYVMEDHSLVTADATVAQVAGQPFDGVVVPGGAGPETMRQDPGIVQLVRDCHIRGRLCAAICHGQQVLISAGLMRGVRATAAWSILDDLRLAGAIVPEGLRAVRDGHIVTAVYPPDLPAFFDLIFQVLADQIGRPVPGAWGQRLAGQTWGIVVGDATDATQTHYPRWRIQEEGGRSLLLGSRAGAQVRLSGPGWAWGEVGWRATVERALPNPGASQSGDSEAELESQAITAAELDGLLLPGGLATWALRGHPGLRRLIGEMHRAGKPLGAVERGPRLLLTTDVLEGRALTCGPQMRDDVLQSAVPMAYREAPVVRDGNLLTCQETEDLPAFMEALLTAYGSVPDTPMTEQEPDG